ncbi:hypothetical protein COUCH_32880 [Couchioplanes caeruleus]|uniref:hypothetical protein n=1 Tax=Couchioplanes caeruleus TaxID=56438 RepID=UPI0020BDECC8|nr:hypothetical protein [Couchioplanes caeruleus]UQU63737.1 hypothetical protein COUCH_32880 [Couchioplanes caeruleus]
MARLEADDDLSVHMPPRDGARGPVGAVSRRDPELIATPATFVALSPLTANIRTRCDARRR